MKKFVALILALVMVMSLAACGGTRPVSGRVQWAELSAVANCDSGL